MNNFYNPTPDFYNDYIAHHGIKGQKWGKRNGPPYPLGSDKSTGSRLKNTGSVNKKTSKSKVTTNKKQPDNAIENQDLLKESNMSKDKSRSIKAAKLGLKALMEIGDIDKDNITDSNINWFLFEDQTIGLATISDLINQGKSKKEIKSLIKQAETNNSKSYESGYFELRNVSRDVDKFIDACFKIKENKKGK